MNSFENILNKFKNIFKLSIFLAGKILLLLMLKIKMVIQLPFLVLTIMCKLSKAI